MLSLEKYKVAIIGAGPSGGILGAFLAQKKVDVTLVDSWKDHISAIRNYGLQIRGVTDLKIHFKKDHLKTSIQELKNTGINLVFICVKTPYLNNVVQDLKKVISEETLVVSHQNGAGNEDILVETFGAGRSFRDVINYAGNILKPGIIEMTFFNPPNYVGAVFPGKKDIACNIAQLISSPDFKTDFHENIQHAVWKKVILSAALAPVCAITGQTMQEALELKETKQLARYIIEEGIKVMEAIGIQFGADFHNFCMSYLSKGGHHKPSMLIDIENRNPTEIEFLNGKIVELGKKFNIPVPFNEATTIYIKALESKC